jgi:hypothetical protein
VRHASCGAARWNGECLELFTSIRNSYKFLQGADRVKLVSRSVGGRVVYQATDVELPKEGVIFIQLFIFHTASACWPSCCWTACHCGDLRHNRLHSWALLYVYATFSRLLPRLVPLHPRSSGWWRIVRAHAASRHILLPLRHHPRAVSQSPQTMSHQIKYENLAAETPP